MKKISNEIVVGAVSIITIIVFVWLFSFLKGKNILKSSTTYYAVYEHIGGLDAGSPVEINGFNAGSVHKIDFINDGSGRLLISIGLNKAYEIPHGTIAEICTETIIAGMKVQLILGESSSYHSNGDTISGRLAESSFKKLDEEFDPMMKKVRLVVSELDTLLKGLNNIITPELQKNISEGSESFKNISNEMENLLKDSGSNTSELITNLNDFSRMLSANNSAIDSTIRNISSISNELANSDLRKSVKSLKLSIDKTTILIEKLNKGEGSAGLFLNNDSLYYSLVNSLEQLNLILDDLKNDPGKYVNFSVFGGNRKGKD